MQTVIILVVSGLFLLNLYLTKKSGLNKITMEYIVIVNTIFYMLSLSLLSTNIDLINGLLVLVLLVGGSYLLRHEYKIRNRMVLYITIVRLTQMIMTLIYMVNQ